MGRWENTGRLEAAHEQMCGVKTRQLKGSHLVRKGRRDFKEIVRKCGFKGHFIPNCSKWQFHQFKAD